VKRVVRLITAAATVALGTLALVPTAQAYPTYPFPNPTTFAVEDSQTYEYITDCSTQGPPYPCSTHSTTLYVPIWTSMPVNQQVTLGYSIEPITATAGVDYIGTTGTTVMAAYTNHALVAIPVLMDGVAEPTETLRVRLTSSSIGGNISDTGIGSILNDGQIPADCTLTRPDLTTTALACTGRPATQQWQVRITCYNSGGWGYVTASGQVVTGNGTSVVQCTLIGSEYGYPYFSVLS
jgi:hypothetical protein